MKPGKAKELLLKKREKQTLDPESAVNTGSTLLNLACTDRIDLGFRKGCYYYFVGDSTSGKTWLSMTCFAEAAINPSFAGYDFVFDDVEGGAKMDIAHYFGQKVADRIRAPRRIKGEDFNSTTIEDFYDNIHRALDRDRPFIYVLDSQDALDSKAAKAKFDLTRNAKEGEKVAGSYGDGKAKYHSEHLRTVVGRLREKKSILIFIGQTRDNLSGMGFETKTRSGGKALRFYATLELWTSVHKKIQKNVRGKDRTIGGNIFVEVRKNRETGKVGKDRGVLIPIYYGHGIDDTGSCVNFLISEKHWLAESKGVFNAKDFKFIGKREQIIRYIADNDLELPLQKLTGRVWAQIEEESEVTRKKKYT